MTDKKKQPRKTDAGTLPKTSLGNELWRKWKVKPDLESIPTTPSESGIGKRIAYCRGQLDNLSVEALARYIKNFDNDGISRTTIVRYESGENIPGARELRVLCDALWVSPNWLLLGAEDLNSQSIFTTRLADAAKLFVLNLVKDANQGLIDSFVTEAALRRAESEIEQRPQKEKEEVEKRQKWIDEARKPMPK